MNFKPVSTSHKPKLLVLELWGLGDLAMASPFLQAASKKFDVTVVAKSYACDLQARFWSDVKVLTWNAPWTAFRRKYHIWLWPWKNIVKTLSELRNERFDFAVSARWDPRDHGLMWLIGARETLGFPRTGSSAFLTQPFDRIEKGHRYEYWRKLAAHLGLELPNRRELPCKDPATTRKLVIHCGAAQPTRIWPLEKFRDLAKQLRKRFDVQIVCDSSQRDWWCSQGEMGVFTAKNVTELIQLFDTADVFIGNDSGPGHLAALCGVRTFTIFGPVYPSEYAPLHPHANWIEGKPCPFKPCRDYCHFPQPNCIHQISAAEVEARLEDFL